MPGLHTPAFFFSKPHYSKLKYAQCGFVNLFTQSSIMQHNDANFSYAPLLMLMALADSRVKIVPYLSSGPRDGSQSDPIREQQKEPVKMSGNSTFSNVECLKKHIMGTLNKDIEA